MTEDDDEVAGGRVYRHGDRTKPFTPAAGSEDAEILEDHIDSAFGKVETVFHELLSDLVHIDVHVIPPTESRNFTTLVTSGMSDLPMAAPERAPQCRFAELLLHLPPDWPVSDAAFEDEQFYWPVRLLKSLARFPHEYDTWLWWGHTLPNGDPAEPYEPSFPFSCALIKESWVYSAESATLMCSPEKTVQFFAVAPLFQDEMELKLRKGTETLLKRWSKRRIIPELVTPKRQNVGRSMWRLF
jgi:hypothetical protein